MGGMGRCAGPLCATSMCGAPGVPPLPRSRTGAGPAGSAEATCGVFAEGAAGAEAAGAGAAGAGAAGSVAAGGLSVAAWAAYVVGDTASVTGYTAGVACAGSTAGTGGAAEPNRGTGWAGGRHGTFGC